jgi:hypothetical protein
MELLYSNTNKRSFLYDVYHDTPKDYVLYLETNGDAIWAAFCNILPHNYPYLMYINSGFMGHLKSSNSYIIYDGYTGNHCGNYMNYKNYVMGVRKDWVYTIYYYIMAYDNNIYYIKNLSNGGISHFDLYGNAIKNTTTLQDFKNIWEKYKMD